MQMHNDVLSSPPSATSQHKSPSKSPPKTPKKSRTKVDLEMEARRLKRVCRYCNVELLSDEYLATHLSGRKHRQALRKKATKRNDLAGTNANTTPNSNRTNDTSLDEKDKDKDTVGHDKEKDKEDKGNDDEEDDLDAGDDKDTTANSTDLEINGSAYECVVTIPLEPNLPYLTLSSPAKVEAITDAERALKKRAKKTKSQIAQLALSYPPIPARIYLWQE